MRSDKVILAVAGIACYLMIVFVGFAQFPVPVRRFNADIAQDLPTTFIPAKQYTAQELYWSIKNDGVAVSITSNANIAARFVYEPTSLAWEVTCTGTVENYQDALVKFRLEKTQLTNSGAFGFDAYLMQVDTDFPIGGTNVMVFASGTITVSRTAGVP
jgi:hypothetical protein